MSASTLQPHQKELFGHPIGLFVLFFTEMWERFSYYGMRAILVLYLVSQTDLENAGLGWTNGDALALYGWYTMMVYVMSIPGGIIADKLLGQKTNKQFDWAIYPDKNHGIYGGNTRNHLFSKMTKFIRESLGEPTVILEEIKN